MQRRRLGSVKTPSEIRDAGNNELRDQDADDPGLKRADRGDLKLETRNRRTRFRKSNTGDLGFRELYVDH